MKKNVLVTGGAGFIGSNLSGKLVELGYNVTVLDDLSPQIHGSANNSSLYLSIKDKVKFVKGDVRSERDWLKALDGQEIVVHLAAETGTGQSMYQVKKYVDVNIKGTGILLDYLVNSNHNIEKVIVASSRAIYGEGKYFCESDGVIYPTERSEKDLLNGFFEPRCPVCKKEMQIKATDEESKIHPSSLYGITKQNQEQMVLNITKAVNVPSVAFRYQNVYGPGQSLKNPYTGILSIFSTQMRNHNSINIFEDGNESRDFVFIDDVVRATILGIESEKGNFKAYNVGSGIPTTVLKVARKLKELYDSDVDIKVTGNFRVGDIRHNYADLTKITDTLHFQPLVTFENGLRKFVDWVLEQEITEDKYALALEEMKSKGLFK
jgi:dTDP-L-rhamnose 4-epimerase